MRDPRTLKAGVAILVLGCLPLPAWANADLPIYSTGFMGFTALLALPLIILGEGTVLWLMSRDEPRFRASAYGIAARANVLSALVGLLALPTFGALLITFWAHVAGRSTDPLVYSRQFFVAAYLATVWVEAGCYNAQVRGARWSVIVLPEGKYWWRSIGANSVSYGVIAWLLVLGKLHDSDLAPMWWRLLERSPAFR